MHKLMELKDKLMEELGDYSANEKFSREDVESIKYIASGIDHICNIIDHESGSYGGYDWDGSYMRRRSSYRGGRRGSMGKYDGYSRAKEDMAAELRELMDDAPDAQTRQEIEKIVKRLDQMK